MAAQLGAQLLACGAVCEWDVVVSNIIEEVDLILLQHQSSGDGMNRSITPSLVEETTILVERLEVIGIRLGT